MSQPRTVAVLIGSLRKESFTRKTVRALQEVAPAGLKLEIVEIGHLPFYNEDLEADPPAPWVEFRIRIRPVDAVLFASPEYNRSVPAALKNAIDVGSRPYGSSVYSGKPAAVLTVSPGVIGGFGANHHLRQSLVFLDMPVLQQPESYLGGVAKWFDAEGRLTDQSARDFLTKFAAAFAAWIDRVAKA
jgi:chromate reductase